MNTDGLLQRIDLAIDGEKTHAFAKRAGIPDSTFRSIRNGSVPSIDKLVAIARAANVRLEWLATGDGPMRPSDNDAASSPSATAAEASIPATDARLIGRLTEKILLVYKEMGVAVAIHQATERAAKEHDRIVATVADPDDRLTEVGEVTAALRQELRAAAADPASSKRRA